MASLRFLGGALQDQDIELTADPMTVGRSSSCQIQVTDAGVSSKHAKVWCENNVFIVKDLGSTNGTFVNDKDVDEEQLSDGDVVRFGHTKAKFVGDDRLKDSDISVETDNHVVTLSGTVMTAAGRAHAVAEAKSIEGVHRVVDKLTIGPKR